MSSFVSRRMLVRLVLLLAILAIWLVRTRTGNEKVPADSVTVERLWSDRTSGVMVDAAGTVERLLADDDEGSRHQRFLMALPSGHTLLVAHNIDLAERVPIEAGDEISARGQYEWNDRGGVLHWTHHDPDGHREGGWIEHRSRRYR